MRLSRLHTDERNGVLASEGMLDNLGKGGRAKLQAAMLHPSGHGLRELVTQAKEIPEPLLDGSPAANQWWVRLLDHYSIPATARKDCMDKVQTIIRRKIGDYVSDKPEPYLRGLAGRRGARRTAIARLLSQVAKDRQNMREAQGHDVDEWSGGIRRRAINELVATLAIRHVDQYAQMLQQNGQQQNGQQQNGQQQSNPKQQEAQQVAEKLWKLAVDFANGRAELTPQDARKYIDTLKQLGFKVRWRGQKSEKYPNGDQPPLAVPAEQ